MELVVFDGTSAFIINETELKGLDVEVLGRFDNSEEADDACENYNYQIDRGYMV